MSRQKLPIVCAPEKADCLFHKCMKELQSWNVEQLQWLAKNVWVTNVQGLILPVWGTCTLCAHTQTNKLFYFVGIPYTILCLWIAHTCLGYMTFLLVLQYMY